MGEDEADATLVTLAPLPVEDNVSVELCGEELASVVASQLVDELHELGPELHMAAIDEDADVLAPELVEAQVEVEVEDEDEDEDDVEELLRRLFAGLGCAVGVTVAPIVRATRNPFGLCTTVLLLCSLELLVHAAVECSDSSSSASSSCATGLLGVGGL